MNRSAPNLHATIKLHKQNTPIRPIFNWKIAPAKELAKQLSKMLQNYLNFTIYVQRAQLQPTYDRIKNHRIKCNYYYYYYIINY